MSLLLHQKLRGSLSYLWLIIAAGYLAVSAGQAVVRDYRSQQETDNLKTQLNDLNLEKQRLEALIVYYKTDDYKEKELRQSLLLVRPEERVYALPESGNVISLEDQALKITHDTGLDGEKKNPDPYWRQWVNYLL